MRNVYDNGEVLVFYADWGTLDTVNKNDIRLDIDLEDVPVQAVRCTLYNLKPAGDASNGWEIDDLNKIHPRAVDKKFKVHVKAAGPPIQVVLFQLNGRNFNKELVAENLAEFVEIEPKKKYKKKKGPRKTNAESN